ncbi:MAG TPA: PilZ domain-containing protein [Syntrophobacteraceae bacterium]|nr:PilZ domain-containing protein [Syntrophobacteraceae bacterium]
MDRRSSKRTRKVIRIQWKNEDVVHDGVTLDICPGGIFVITSQKVPPSSQIHLQLWLGKDSPLSCRGRVTWVNRGQVVYYPPGFGVQFLDLPEESRKILDPICDGYDPIEAV